MWIPATLLADLHDSVREHAPLETGGMLLGWYSQGQIAITSTIAAGPSAIRLRTSFTPDGHWQQQQLTAVYQESGRTVTYLGDWHSHPRGSARPSSQDCMTAAVVAANDKARTPNPITIIIGRIRRRARLVARAYIHTDGKLHRTTLQTYGREASNKSLSDFAAARAGRSGLRMH